METFIYFWLNYLNYCDKNNHNERIPVELKNISHLFSMACQVFESELSPCFPYRHLLILYFQPSSLQSEWCNGYKKRRALKKHMNKELLHVG